MIYFLYCWKRDIVIQDTFLKTAGGFVVKLIELKPEAFFPLLVSFVM